VLSVSAVDINRQPAPYSNRGPDIDLAAPGGNNGVDFNGDGYPDGVLSTGGVGTPDPEFAYTFLSGTSMAAPHVAGVIALMRSINPQLTAADLEVLLRSGALTDDLGNPGRDDNTGHGIINAYKSVLSALDTLGSDTVDTPRLSVSAGTLSFGSSTQPLELQFSNAGRGELTITQVSASETWLQISPLQVSENGLGTYRVSVDRQGLQDGVYSGSLAILSSANAITIRVFMSVGSPGGEADVGTVYVLLYDSSSNEPVDQFAVQAINGRYVYRFTGVPAGEYELIAGSDADNDLFICDGGEACGAWLTLDQPGTLSLDRNRDNVDFPVEYQVFLPELSATAIDTRQRVVKPQLRLPGKQRPGASRVRRPKY
jgi:serine protease